MLSTGQTSTHLVMNGIVNNWPNQSVIPWFSTVMFMGNNFENSKPRDLRLCEQVTREFDSAFGSSIS